MDIKKEYRKNRKRIQNYVSYLRRTLGLEVDFNIPTLVKNPALEDVEVLQAITPKIMREYTYIPEPPKETEKIIENVNGLLNIIPEEDYIPLTYTNKKGRTRFRNSFELQDSIDKINTLRDILKDEIEKSGLDVVAKRMKDNAEIIEKELEVVMYYGHNLEGREVSFTKIVNIIRGGNGFSDILKNSLS